MTMSNSKHGKPADGMCCFCTMEDITEEDGNYVEYQTHPSMTWHPCLYERSIVEHLLTTQFGDFLNRVKKTDCQAELRRLLKDGPPIFLSDKHALPIVSENDTHVCALWYAAEDKEVSAKLEGAVEGDDRENLWNELRKFLVEDGKEPGDDDATEGEANVEEASN